MIVGKGESMDPRFRPGTKVPVRLMPPNTQYKKGDIIAFKPGDNSANLGILALHYIEEIYKLSILK